MACLMHLCHTCGYEWEENTVNPVCKKCGHVDVSSEWDEQEEDRSDD